MNVESQILTTNGRYECIKDLKVGDLIMNRDGKAIKITGVKDYMCNNVYSLTCQNWYDDIYIDGSMRVITPDGSKLIEELSAGDLLAGAQKIHTLLLRDNFSVEVNGNILTPSFDLGYLFGIYAGYGYIANNAVAFTFGPNIELANVVESMLSRFFGAKCIVERTEPLLSITITTTNAGSVQFFTNFGNKITRTIPSEYLVNNKDYIQGIYEGLIEFDPTKKTCRYISVSKSMCEIFTIITSILTIEFAHETPQGGKFKIYPLYTVQNDTSGTRILKIKKCETPMQMYTVNTEDGDCVCNSLVIRN